MEFEYFSTIADTLKSVKRPGFFATGGLNLMSLPSISLNFTPDTILGLPLGKCQEKLIIASSTQAPFGRGEETIVDTSVRCTWQLSPEQFTLNNSQWTKQLYTLLDKVKGELGCDPNMKVDCELYKLLLYEPGGFFKRHRDTEKSDGMFGTMVIQLPSDYTGGQLAVYHQSKCKEFDFGGPVGCANIHYAAFYADCQHEIKPVTKGSRLCLIYNLVYKGVGDSPAPVDNQQAVSTVVSSMVEWGEDEEGPEMMVYLLEHKYCDASLSFQLLKNSDRAVADVLMQAKNEENFDLCLAKVTIAQNWSASGSYYCHDYSLHDLNEEYVAAQSITSLEGRSICSHIDLDKELFVPEDFLDDLDPDKEEFEEATGNEGATVDKQYNWAALLIWPSSNRFQVLGIDSAVKSFNSDLHDQSTCVRGKAELEVEAKDLLRVCSSPHHSKGVSADSYALLLESLQVLANAELIKQFLNDIVSPFHDRLFCNSSLCQEIFSVGKKYGLEMLKPPLQAVFEKVTSLKTTTINSYCQFLLKLSCEFSSEAQASEVQDMCLPFAAAIVRRGSQTEEQENAVGLYLSSPDAYVALLQILQKFGKLDLVSELLNGMASAACPQALVSSPSFCEEILAIGKKHGWDLVKLPLQAIFSKMPSSGKSIDSYNRFISKFAQQPCSEVQKNLCRDLIRIVVSSKPNTSGHFGRVESYVSFLGTVRSFCEEELVSKAFDLIAAASMPNSFVSDSSFISEVLAVGRQFGWNVLKSSLVAIFNAGISSDMRFFDSYYQFLSKISQTQSSVAQGDVCRGLAGVVVSALTKEPNTKANSLPSYHWISPSSSCPRGKKFLASLFDLLKTIQCSEQLLSTLIQLLIAKPNRYPLQETLVPACGDLYKSIKAGEVEGGWLKQLRTHCISSLEASSSHVMAPPRDWSDFAAISCTCKDCLVLLRFLKHPTETESRYKMGQKRRNHLGAQLHNSRASVSIATESYGNPHTMVVTKTREAYNKDCQRAEKERALLSRLRALVKKLSGSSTAEAVKEPSGSKAAEPVAKRPKLVAIDLTEM